jgi:hypothetical protein
LGNDQCPGVDGGVAQVCLPDFALVFVTGNLTDQGGGFCAAQSPGPLPVGSACAPVNSNFSYPSPCVAGAMCWNNAGTGWSCQQLCALDGGAGCPTGTTCQPAAIAPGVNSTVSGVCI